MELPEELFSLYMNTIVRCEKCPNFVCSRKMYMWKKPTMGYGTAKSSIIIVAQSPGPKGCGTTGLVFEPASKTGKIYENALKLAGLSFEKVYTTNLIKCCTFESNSYPSEEEVDNCLPYLLKEIEIIKPKKIIAVGKFAGNILYKHKTELQGADLELIVHPGYILRSGKRNFEYIQDFAALLKSAGAIKTRQSKVM